ncbi:TonB-dependent receptor [Serratia fonticola]|nr:TonB-dependent receptor [Serratia fonticola]NYA37050.1 TonB-dependent receptor [Serratia fonticola]
MYGRQKPREYAEIRNVAGTLSTQEVGAYSVVGIGVNYDLMKDLSLKTGVTNLFDKQIYRENEGASTYNEPGRAYYAGLALSF